VDFAEYGMEPLDRRQLEHDIRWRQSSAGRRVAGEAVYKDRADSRCREKPFLQVDTSGSYSVRVPALRQDSSGITWRGGTTGGVNIQLCRFYIARPDVDTIETLNAELAKGRNLLFTPGIYGLTGTLRVTRPSTVVLGLGFATLRADGGTIAMSTADVDGVIIAGLLFDAGTENSPVLLEIGPTGSSARRARNPISLHDVFFRWAERDRRARPPI
jgi:hypothetical protein